MSQNPSSKPQFLMETIIYSVIILIGVGLRFALLGHHPLNDGEASLALQALALSRGEETVLSGEPGFLSLTTVSFFIFPIQNFGRASGLRFLGLVPFFYLCCIVHSWEESYRLF